MNDLFTPTRHATRTVIVQFDGGTSCNIPRLGYGDGYGSYKIDECAIVRLEFGEAMSANAAEVLTLARALEAIESPETARVRIIGDSQIALNQAVPISKKRKKMPSASGSNIFRDNCARLRAIVARFAHVETQWRGRAASVALFGH